MFAALLFCSCASLTPERVQVLSAIAQQAAHLGVQEWLRTHPSHRDAFQLVLSTLTGLIKAGETNQAVYAAYLNSLPTRTLAGPAGELYVTGDKLVIWDAELEKAVAVEGRAEQPVIRATVAGMQRALGPQPPMPTAKRQPALAVKSRTSSSPYTLELKPGVPTNAQPTRAFIVASNLDGATYFGGHVVWLSKTNITRSTVDVHGNALTVRWQAGPKSVYHIEHRDPSIRIGGDTNWYRFGSLTNISGTGQTNWQTVWPNIPHGQWRVLRVR